MVTYEQAIENVRRDFKGWMIRVGYDLPDEFLFTVSPNSDYSIDDTTACYAVVDKRTGNTKSESIVERNFNIADIRELDRINKLMTKTQKPVDLNKDQWAEYLALSATNSGPDISKMSDEEIEAINAARKRSIARRNK